jgi:hypothetical protein
MTVASERKRHRTGEARKQNVLVLPVYFLWSLIFVDNYFTSTIQPINEVQRK